MYIQIQSRRFDFTNPEIKLSDICHNLARTNRYLGATDTTISVAEHTLLGRALASLIQLPADLMLPWLLHDAAEAYLGDINAVIKHKLEGWFPETEERLNAVIAAKFGIHHSMFHAPMVEHLDKLCLYVESKSFFKNRDDDLWTWLDDKFSTLDCSSWINAIKNAGPEDRNPPEAIEQQLKAAILESFAS